MAFAERLAADGYDLILPARRRDRLEALAARLRPQGAAVEILAGDLTDRDFLASLEARIASDDRLAFLINDAGLGAYGPFLELDPDLAEKQIAVHLTASVRLARAALPGMVARGKGAMVNVASTFAFSSSVRMPARKRASYVASKAHLVAFTELLSHELEGTGVAVQALCPGVVRTEFHDGLGGRPPGVAVLEPADVVTASLAGLALGEVICIPQLEDLSALQRFLDARNALWDSARSETIAGRYKSKASR
jgi:short-subunit dehydrogenase